MRTQRARASFLFALAVVSGFWAFLRYGGNAGAAGVQRMSDVMTRATVDTFADHAITFVTPSGVDAASDTVAVTFANPFAMGTFAVANVDFAVDNDDMCNGPWTERTLASSAGVGTWGVAQVGHTLTLTPPTDAALGEIPTNRCVRLKIGANASVGGTGTTQLKNPTLPNAYRIDIAGGFGDTGFFWVSVIAQDTVQVTATVPSPTPPTPPDTIVVFRGLAYPSSTVTIQRGATILATVGVDAQARFDVSAGSQPAGINTYTLFAEDSSGHVGRSYSFTIAITTGTTTTISGIFLSPTIEVDQTVISPSETVTVSGSTAPSSQVTVFVSSEEELTFQTLASAAGIYVQQVLGSDVGLGDHNARTKAVSTASEISGFSDTVAFTVTAETPDLCAGRNRADLNCDGKVNLVDFSILLFYWRKPSPFANERVDLNLDDEVTLVDLSILLFNWAP